MAEVVQRTWKSGPRRARRTAWGFTLMANGKQVRRYNSAWTEQDAEKALAARLLAPAPATSEPETRTLGQLVDEYLQYKNERGKRSLKEDRRILKRRILPVFGAELPVGKVTGPVIAQYERQRGGEVSAYTVSNELTVLRHMLRLAKRWGYVNQVPDIDMPRKPEGRQRYLDESDIRRLLDACRRSRNPYLEAIVVLALNTGMRKSEILGLEWPRIDLSTGRVTLYQTKSGKPRGLPMNRAVYDALVALQPAAEQRTGLVFRRSAVRAWGQIRTAFTTALDRAGIKGFRFHDLRHTAASHMVMRGASLKDVQEILGHADYKMTLRYSHLSPAHLRAAVDRLDGLTVSTTSTQSAVESSQRVVSVDAPVAQVDRAAVS